MRLLVVIFPKKRGYYYEIFYKLTARELEMVRKAQELLDKVFGDFVDILLGGRIKYLERRIAHPLANEYTREHWKYLCSGHTDHDKEFLQGIGIKSPDDLEGLKKFLENSLSRYGDVQIIVKE